MQACLPRGPVAAEKLDDVRVRLLHHLHAAGQHPDDDDDGEDQRYEACKGHDVSFLSWVVFALLAWTLVRRWLEYEVRAVHSADACPAAARQGCAVLAAGDP